MAETLSPAQNAIALADRYAAQAPMRSSAELCLSDARGLLARGHETLAHVRAMRSLAYSIGVFHPDYVAADLPSLPDTQGWID